MVIALEATKVETLTMGSLFTCIALLTMDPHHLMATPQCLLDTIGQPHNVKVKKKAYNNCHKLCLSSRLARCKNHLWRSVTANIEGEQLPGPIVTCNSAFGGTFYAGSSAGGSAPANDSEVEQEASIQDLIRLPKQCNCSASRGSKSPSSILLKDNKSLVAGFDQKVLIVRRNKHKDTVQLLMNLGTFVAQFTVLGVQLSIMFHVAESRNVTG
ncbi:hypothetical protein HID58_050406 [Brassica napus]|uniref:Uncharacterized protein n=1 Tax=Brassica napus TaxID=3708 RepID=A0ABQ8A6Q6_BRANA|nr:hypothetical protein HID58_050406 [Brassica napus]